METVDLVRVVIDIQATGKEEHEEIKFIRTAEVLSDS
jgi:hypothetical protein